MGTIPAKDLLNKWKQNDLPIEMVLGHLLQHLVLTENQLKEDTLVQRKQQTDIKQVSHELETVKAELSQLQRDMAQVLDHLSLESKPPKRKRGRPPKKKG